MLRIENLHASYGKIAVLHGIDLNISNGEFVAILGPNGAGKSTLIKTIAGVHTSQSATLTLFGETMEGLSPAQRITRGLGAIPEGRQLFSDMTVRENLMLGAYARLGFGIPQSINDDLAEIFDLFPRMRDRQAQVAGSLSGGEAQMLAIARALMGKPKLLLCDEPSLGLAPMMVRDMLAALSRLREKGIAVLIADQNAVAALKLADRAYVIDTGRVITHGKSADLLHDRRLHEAYFGRDFQGTTD